MLAAYSRSWVTVLILLLAFLIPASADAQAPPNPGISGIRNYRMDSQVWIEKCLTNSPDKRSLSPFAIGGEPHLLATQWSDDENLPSGVASCRERDDGVTGPALRVLPAAHLPCVSVKTVPTGHSQDLACVEREDAVFSQLSSLGKVGVRIATARAGILDLLRSQNVCSEWFATKDADPAGTFRSLIFFIDHQGPDKVLEWGPQNSITFFRQPYVARATQGGGAYSQITINANGAFYRSQGAVRRVSEEEGPVRMDGSQYLRVGAYSGNTLEAQILTLLHEFGHIIDLLPEDANDVDGKSVHNTEDVLGHCRTEVEASAKEARQAAKK